jgi:hypothetical protein
MWKISPPLEFDPRTVLTVASRYTDYATPAHGSYRARKILLWSLGNGNQFVGLPVASQIRFQASSFRIRDQQGTARTVFLLSPVSIITLTLHTDISFIYLGRYTITPNDCVMEQHPSLRRVPTTRSLVTIPTELPRFKQQLNYRTWTDRWHNKMAYPWIRPTLLSVLPSRMWRYVCTNINNYRQQ